MKPTDEPDDWLAEARASQLRFAATDLDRLLAVNDWFIAVGVTNDSLIVYSTRNLSAGVVPSVYQGFPVTIEKTSRLKPAQCDLSDKQTKG